MTPSQISTILEAIGELRESALTKEDMRPYQEMLAHHEQVLFHGNGKPPITETVALILVKLDEMKADISEIKGLKAKAKDTAADWWKWAAGLGGGAIITLLIYLVTMHIGK